jgi:hypothetical protein
VSRQSREKDADISVMSNMYSYCINIVTLVVLFPKGFGRLRVLNDIVNDSVETGTGAPSSSSSTLCHGRNSGSWSQGVWKFLQIWTPLSLTWD